MFWLLRSTKKRRDLEFIVTRFVVSLASYSSCGWRAHRASSAHWPLTIQARGPPHALQGRAFSPIRPALVYPLEVSARHCRFIVNARPIRRKPCLESPWQEFGLCRPPSRRRVEPIVHVMFTRLCVFAPVDQEVRSAPEKLARPSFLPPFPSVSLE